MLSNIRAYLASHHSYVLAAGLFGLALYQVSTGNGESAGQSIVAALAALGLKVAGKPAQ